jgi:23S rRNA (cytosine1962-C5)-methyltransferase
MRVWHVRKGAEAKVRRGYPWVFSNELSHSPRDAEPGEAVELRDHTDAPLAFGYGHPHALIAFRSLFPGDKPWDGNFEELLTIRLRRAAGLRRKMGVAGTSHRWCFAEGDGLPGLIVDRYRLSEAGAPAQVLAVHLSTSGMERALPEVLGALERLVEEQDGAGAWERTAVLLDQGSALRTMEQLPLLPKVWKRLPPGAWDGTQPTGIQVGIGLGVPEGEPFPFRVDFLGGQKTGFFLDHRHNLGLASDLLSVWLAGASGNREPLRVLDLFSYVGQWGGVLARRAAQAGIPVEVVAVDASERALALAAENIPATAAGGAPVTVRVERRDIVESLEGIPSGVFDVVVCDPPALAKRRKDVLKAARAYQKLNREALRRVRPGGLIVTCSCSALLGEEEFREMLQRAQVQAGREVHWVVRGGQGLDHPVRAEFPEGRYLKCWMGIVDA